MPLEAVLGEVRFQRFKAFTVSWKVAVKDPSENKVIQLKLGSPTGLLLPHVEKAVTDIFHGAVLDFHFFGCAPTRNHAPILDS